MGKANGGRWRARYQMSIKKLPAAQHASLYGVFFIRTSLSVIIKYELQFLPRDQLRCALSSNPQFGFLGRVYQSHVGGQREVRWLRQCGPAAQPAWEPISGRVAKVLLRDNH